MYARRGGVYNKEESTEQGLDVQTMHGPAYKYCNTLKTALGTMPEFCKSNNVPNESHSISDDTICSLLYSKDCLTRSVLYCLAHSIMYCLAHSILYWRSLHKHSFASLPYTFA